MSVHTVKLELPFGFVPDPILDTATPEQCAIVLTTGCVALKALLKKTDVLSYNEAYEKATAEEGAKWLTQKSQLIKNALREKKELENENAVEVKQLKDELSSLRKQMKHKEEELTKAETLRAKAETEATTLRQSELDTIIRERERTRTQIESEKSYEIEQLKKDLDKAKAAAEKAASDLREVENKAAADALQALVVKNEEINSAVDKIRKEFNEELTKERDKNVASAIRANKSVFIGKDNEDAFAELLDRSFGTDQHYRKLPKTTESGDHIIEWKGMKLMFENKKYANTVPKSEVDKALRDFVKHPECDVLIFVSEDSSIINRKRHFDITCEDGRPAIWIGEFCHNEDKVVYLQLVGQVAEELIRLQRREKKFENGEEIIDYKNKVEDLIQLFNVTKDDLDNLLKFQKRCQREQNAIWKKLNREIVSVIARFNSSQSDANGNKDEDEVEADSEPKAKKQRRTPAKNKLPQSNNMLNYVNKSPRQVATQPQQGPSSGFTVEIDQNQAKQQLNFQ